MPDDPIDPSDLSDDQAALRAMVTKAVYAALRARGYDVKEGNTAYYTFTGPYGWVEVYYHHEDKLAEWALAATHDILKQVFEDAAAELKLTGQVEDNLEVQLKSDTAFKVATSAFLGHFIIEGMLDKLSSAFVELGFETKNIFKGIVCSEVERGNLPVPNPNDLVEDYSKKMVASRKQFLKNTIAAYVSPHRWMLKQVYEELLPVWEKARSIYKRNNDLPTWKKMIEAAFHDHAYPLPLDLVAMLSGDPDDLNDLPEKMRDAALKATEGGEDYTKASNLALEHSARLCRYTPFQYGPRTLRIHMTTAPAVASEPEPVPAQPQIDSNE
jgi:hypothetical protein